MLVVSKLKVGTSLVPSTNQVIVLNVTLDSKMTFDQLIRRFERSTAFVKF